MFSSEVLKINEASYILLAAVAVSQALHMAKDAGFLSLQTTTNQPGWRKERL